MMAEDTTDHGQGTPDPSGGASGPPLPVPSADDRRSGRPGPAPQHERRSGIELTPGQLARRRVPHFGEGPVLSMIAISVCALVALAFLGIGFSRPATRLVPLVGAYQQAGTFSYSAPVIAATAVYPSGVVTTGQPIYPSLVKTVAMTYHYAFTSPLPHDVHGTIEFKALLLSQTDTWQDVSTIHPLTSFRGDDVTVTSQLDLTDLYSFITKVSQQADVASTTYSADLQPVVHLVGVVGGRRIDSTFEPVLPFAVTQNAITLSVAAAVAPPGATYSVPTASAERASTLHPVQVGSIPHPVPNVATVAKFTIRVSAARLFGIVFAVLTVGLLGLDETFRRRATRRTDEEILAAKMHVLVVPVTSLGEQRPRSPIDVDRFAYLARLAHFLERPILYQLAGGQRTYAVDDELRQYRYRPVEDVSTGGGTGDDAIPRGERRGGPRASDPRAGGQRNRPTWQSVVGRGAAAVGITAVVVTLATSFTASTNVPVSSVGTSVQLRLLSQLAPAGCSGLSLTRLASGSGTFTNSVANTLLLGSSGANTITDTGGNSCIVGGGGSDTVVGATGDICITGPSLNVAAACPLPVVSNGVGVTPTADNYNNYGGQERLAFTNPNAITAMTITIKVALTGGVTFAAQANSFPGFTVNQSSNVTGGALVFSFVLASGQSIPANYPLGVVYAQYNGTGATHPTSGDTWTVTTTSGGKTSTLSGTF